MNKDSNDTSTTVNLVGEGFDYDSISNALLAFKSSNKKLPSKLLLANNSVGVEGTQSLATGWLQKQEVDCGDIETLSMRSCGVGRQVHPNTGAYVFSTVATASLGLNGDRLVNIDLGWNDLNAASVGELVKGLLAIEAPNFDADSFNPSALETKRSCALTTLELHGNSIGNEGVAWLTLLLNPRTDGTGPSHMKHLGLHQCAIEAEGGLALANYCGGASPGVFGLEGLDLRENDLGEASGPLARAAEVSTTLVTFSGLADLNKTRVALAQAKSPVPVSAATNAAALDGDNKAPVSQAKGVLVAGSNSMCHGALALLLVLRPFVVPQQQTTTAVSSLASPENTTAATEMVTTASSTVKNPLDGTSADGETTTLSGVVVDLRGSAMCGFYQERTEAVEELLSLLAAQHTKPEPPAPPAETSSVTSEVDAEGGGGGSSGSEPALVPSSETTFSAPQLHIHTLEMDAASGLTPNQVKIVFAACAVSKDGDSPAPATILKMDGEVYKAPAMCSIQ